MADQSIGGEEPETSPEIDLAALDAILVDLDGVVTETATTHAQAWKTMFDEYLSERARRLDGTYEHFDLKRDYEKYVDGKLRYDGVASFLESRGINLPHGEESDPPGKATICGLGNWKNGIYLDMVRRHGVQVYETSIDFIRRAKSRGLRAAIVTASRNCSEVLKSAGIVDLFDAQVDGIVAHESMLHGKPAPDTYLEAARRVGVKPARAAVIEDAISGVQAGKAGHFGLVIGVDRAGEAKMLHQSGADIVVSDLGELRLAAADDDAGAIAPAALDRLAEIRERVRGRRVIVFLDYDGTLTPIVERPELAVLSEDMRATVKALARACPVVVISGRERADVERKVGIADMIYAGCHGFDIAGPAGMEIHHEEGAAYVPVIAEVARELERRLAAIEGVIVEHKTYDVAVHFRLVRDEYVGRVEEIVDDVLARYTLLRKSRGKKVFEVRPNMPWDKGKAVLWMLDVLKMNDPGVVPFYLGDDVTDFDAFRALRGKGISVFVAETDQATCADYRLRDTQDVRTFLGELTAIAGELKS